MPPGRFSSKSFPSVCCSTRTGWRQNLDAWFQITLQMTFAKHNFCNACVGTKTWLQGAVFSYDNINMCHFSRHFVRVYLMCCQSRRAKYRSPRLARNHYCQQLTLSVCLSVCRSHPFVNVITCFVCYIKTVSRLVYRTFSSLFATAVCLYV